MRRRRQAAGRLLLADEWWRGATPAAQKQPGVPSRESLPISTTCASIRS